MKALKLKVVLAVGLGLGLTGMGVGWFCIQTLAASQVAGETAQRQDPERADGPIGQTDQDKLFGVWTVVSVEENEKRLEGDRMGHWRTVRFAFTRDRLVIWSHGENKGGLVTWKVDPTKNPKVLQLSTVPAGQADGETSKALYAFEGKNLVLCLNNQPGGEEPNELKSKAGTHIVVLKLERAPPETGGQPKDVQPLPKPSRTQSANNLQQLSLAMLKYESVNGRLPAWAIFDPDGRPLLSWRVTLLPFLEENNLYKRFKLDEPWDGPNNIKLLDKMPKVYAAPGAKTKDSHVTYYQVFTGFDAVFDSTKGSVLSSISDGISNTLLIVEAGEAVPWTKPDDLPYSMDRSLPKLGGLSGDGFYGAFCDGSVRLISKQVSERTIRCLITPRGGEEANLDKLKSHE